MTRAERLAILGAATVAEIHQLVAEAPEPDAEFIEELRHILAPAFQRHRAAESAQSPLKSAA